MRREKREKILFDHKQRLTPLWKYWWIKTRLQSCLLLFLSFTTATMYVCFTFLFSFFKHYHYPHNTFPLPSFKKLCSMNNSRIIRYHRWSFFFVLFLLLDIFFSFPSSLFLFFIIICTGSTWTEVFQAWRWKG